jgi:hypothetical protein
MDCALSASATLRSPIHTAVSVLGSLFGRPAEREVDHRLIAHHTRPGQRRGGILNVYDRPNDLLERPALDAEWW